MALQELFRNEVTQAQRGQWLGSVHLAAPLSFLWLTLLVAALAVGVVLFMVFGHYTRYQRVSGQLVASAGLLDVSSPRQGTVARVYIHQGETVRRGDPLVEISDERNSAALGSAQALIRQQIAATHRQLRRLPLTLVAKQEATQRASYENDQQLAENELQQDTVLRASTSGVVSTLLVKRGQSVAAEQPLLSVFPQGSTLQAQLLVPSSAIGFIQPGKQVVIRYQVFPYQEFGQQYGKVVSVSWRALSNDDATLPTGMGLPQPLYRVLVNLKWQSIAAFGRTHRLRPGMSINADIPLDRRSLWQWALAPISGLRQQAGGGAGQT